MSPASRGWGSSRTSSPSRCIKGFIVGLALTIIIGQVPSLLGVEKGSGDFFAKLWDLLTSLGTANAATVAVGALSLALVLGLRRVAPAVPASLVAVILGVLAVKALSLENHGVDIVGAIKSGLPSVGLPDVSTADFGDLVGPAIGVLLVGFAEPARGRRSPGWCAPRSPS